MQMNVLTDFFAQVGDDHEKKQHFVKMFDMTRAWTGSIPTGGEIAAGFCHFFAFPYVSKGFLMQKNDFFLKKSKKKFFFLRLSVTMS